MPRAGKSSRAAGSDDHGREDSPRLGKSFPRQGRLSPAEEVIPASGETLRGGGSHARATEDFPCRGKSFLDRIKLADLEKGSAESLRASLRRPGGRPGVGRPPDRDL